MPSWMTAEQIANRYVVGEQRLLDYSRRGNLAMMRRPDGVMLFDADDVACFFRPRSATAAQAARGAPAQHLGVLGASRLGVEPPVRRRPPRASSPSVAVVPPRVATGS